MLSRSPKGDSSGLSNARSARVRSISVRHSRLSSPCSASCVCANSNAASVSRRRINSIRCCCWRRKADHFTSCNFGFITLWFNIRQLTVSVTVKKYNIFHNTHLILRLITSLQNKSPTVNNLEWPQKVFGQLSYSFIVYFKDGYQSTNLLDSTA